MDERIHEWTLVENCVLVSANSEEHAQITNAGPNQTPNEKDGHQNFEPYGQDDDVT